MFVNVHFCVCWSYQAVNAVDIELRRILAVVCPEQVNRDVRHLLRILKCLSGSCSRQTVYGWKRIDWRRSHRLLTN